MSPHTSDALERAEAVATAQVAGRGRASAAEQQEARELIKDLIGASGGIQVRGPAGWCASATTTPHYDRHHRHRHYHGMRLGHGGARKGEASVGGWAAWLWVCAGQRCHR